MQSLGDDQQSILFLKQLTMHKLRKGESLHSLFSKTKGKNSVHADVDNLSLWHFLTFGVISVMWRAKRLFSGGRQKCYKQLRRLRRLLVFVTPFDLRVLHPVKSALQATEYKYLEHIIFRHVNFVLGSQIWIEKIKIHLWQQTPFGIIQALSVVVGLYF